MVKPFATCGLIIFFFTWGCTPQESLSYHKRYVQQAFDSIGCYSLERSKINLDSIEALILKRISKSTSHQQVLEFLENAIQAINKHNYMLSPESYHQMNTGANPDVLTNPYPFQIKMLHQKYAFVALSGFLGVDSISAKNYTDSLQKSIYWLSTQQPTGWIIDLRHNSGGWIYPMLAGLGPLLGSGIKAFEISGNQVVEEYYFFKNANHYSLLSDSVWFLKKQLPVVILIGKETGSAGELLTLAFRGNPKTTLIGTPTAGFSTGLRGFIMPDGTQICVTNSIMTDRNKKGDGERIMPDLELSDPLQIFDQAYNWIENNK